jgi:hypothetical protein
MLYAPLKRRLLHHTTWRNIPEGYHLHTSYLENLKSHNIINRSIPDSEASWFQILYRKKRFVERVSTLRFRVRVYCIEPSNLSQRYDAYLGQDEWSVWSFVLLCQGTRYKWRLVCHCVLCHYRHKTWRLWYLILQEQKPAAGISYRMLSRHMSPASVSYNDDNGSAVQQFDHYRSISFRPTQLWTCCHATAMFCVVSNSLPDSSLRAAAAFCRGGSTLSGTFCNGFISLANNRNCNGS